MYAPICSPHVETPQAQSSPGLLCVHIYGPWSCSWWFYGISVAIGQTHQCYADDTQLYLIYSAASPASVNALRLLIQCIKNFVDLTPGSEHNSDCRLWGEGGSQYQPCSPSLRAPNWNKSPSGLVLLDCCPCKSFCFYKEWKFKTLLHRLYFPDQKAAPSFLYCIWSFTFIVMTLHSQLLRL